MSHEAPNLDRSLAGLPDDLYPLAMAQRIDTQNFSIGERFALSGIIFARVINPKWTHTAAGLLNHIHLSPEAARYAALLTSQNRHQREILAEATIIESPNKEVLETRSWLNLLEYSNAKKPLIRPTFPDVSGIPDDLVGLDKVDRIIAALLGNRNPSHGFLPISLRRQRPDQASLPWVRDRFKGIEFNYDFDMWFLNRLYPPELANEMHRWLGNLAHEVAYRPYADEDRRVSNLKFLGLENEEQFRKVVKEMLLSEIQEAGGDPQMVDNFLKFAEQSDEWREKIKESSKRLTGESYYCHYLSAAWLLWTIIKPDVEAKRITPKDATELVATAAVHDLGEDLPSQISWISGNNGEQKYRFEVFDASHSIELTHLQYVLLDAVTKKKDGDWVNNITNLRDFRDPQNSALADKLRHFASLLKTADRWANFLTLVAGCDNHTDAIRKLEETKIAFSRLLFDANFVDLNSMEILAKLDELEESNTFDTLVAGLPILASVEEDVVRARFGREMITRIFQLATEKPKPDPIALYIYQAIMKNLTQLDKGNISEISEFTWDEPAPNDVQYQTPLWLSGTEKDDEIIPGMVVFPPSIPWWKTRFQLLCDQYGVPTVTASNAIHVMQIENHVGLTYFANSRRFHNLPKPLRIGDLKDLVSLARMFQENYNHVPGDLPGNVDGFFMPSYLDPTTNKLLRESERSHKEIFRNV